ncbi:MAG: glycosyltransferase [Chloroflexi bacterium]|nr:glycosyltransferase [Chloroflexota bacterium]
MADGPSAEQAAMLEQLDPPVDGTPWQEVVWTSERLGQGAATNIGLRRAGAPVIIVLDPSLEPTGDIVTPLVRALDDDSVAIVGGWGTVTDDLRRFEEAPAGDADAIDGVLQAFRRDDAAARGPLDEGFRSRRDLDVWWSLALRDEGEGVPVRRARVVAGLPIVRHERPLDPTLADTERDRQDKRNRYRLIDRFGWRRDLIVPR